VAIRCGVQAEWQVQPARPAIWTAKNNADLSETDVEVAHSWFNRFRKLLVRYEKLERSFLALNHLAASIMAFRKIKMDVNIIYG